MTHGIVEHRIDRKKHARCKKCQNESLQRRRKQAKILLVEYRGGKCERCGYSKCIGALEFHHINPKEKDFSLSKTGRSKTIEAMKKEVDKCILLCANCHREEHFT